MNEGMPIRYTSDEFYHIVGRSDPTNHEANFETILKIIDSGRILHTPADPTHANYASINWDADFRAGEPLIKQITCYCDIPYEALTLHLKKYGHFGISFHRQFLIKKGARPVIYHPLQAPGPNTEWTSPHSTSLFDDWINMLRGFQEHIKPLASGLIQKTLGMVQPDPPRAASDMEDFLTESFFAFLKVFNADLPDEDPENFYTEREWRIRGNLSFFPEDIVSIIVPVGYIRRLASMRPDYAGKIIPTPI